MDDFWGESAWAHWENEIAKALPPSEFPIEDVPLSDPIFKSQYTVSRIPQIPRYPFWAGTGRRETSEFGEATREPHFRRGSRLAAWNIGPSARPFAHASPEAIRATASHRVDNPLFRAPVATAAATRWHRLRAR